MAGYDYEQFVVALREVLVEVKYNNIQSLGTTAEELDAAAGVNSIALYSKLSKGASMQTIPAVKAELKILFSTVHKTSDQSGTLLPIFKTAAYYNAADKRVRESNADSSQQLARKPWIEELNLMFGLCTEVAAGPGSAVRRYGMVRKAMLAEQHQEQDPFHQAFLNLDQKWSTTLDSVNPGSTAEPDTKLAWMVNVTSTTMYGRLLRSKFETEDCTLLLLPAMVHALCRALRCLPTQLIVTPYQQGCFYACACSDPLATCMLGDFTCGSTDRSETITMLSPAPITVAHMPTEPLQPVSWKLYQHYGCSCGSVDYDGMIAFPVPATEEDANKISVNIMGGTAPPLVKLQFTDQCFHCRGTSGLKACAKCGTAVYCSADCQRADWPQHKGFCKHQCASGQKGSGVAGPTEGEAVVTPYKFVLQADPGKLV